MVLTVRDLHDFLRNFVDSMNPRTDNPRHQTKTYDRRERSMSKVLWSFAIVIAATLAPSIVRADAITYNVDINLGGDMITGTITTDGTIGTLNNSNITAFTLSEQNNIIPTLTSANGGFLDAIGITALTTTPNNISLNVVAVTTAFVDPSGNEIEIIGGPVDQVIIINPNTHLENENAFPLGTSIGTAAVPEIDNASAPSALALVAGVVLIIRGRRYPKVPTA